MMLNFHISQQDLPGCTSLRLDIVYTDGLLNEEQIRSTIKLATDIIQRDISSAVVSNYVRKKRHRPKGTISDPREGIALDKIFKQVIRKSADINRLQRVGTF